jgi:anthranilate synthase component 2
MIYLVDNYDSFSYNLYQLVGSLAGEVRVIRNDATTASELASHAPVAILLSPGPGRPKDAGICEDVVRTLSGRIPILGVCLGHQAICEAFGATIAHAPQAMHGKSSQVRLDAACPLFAGLSERVQVARYHSLEAEAATLPACLEVVAETHGEVMAVAHTEHPTFGLQFHPESILTPEGPAMMRSFLLAKERFWQTGTTR